MIKLIKTAAPQANAYILFHDKIYSLHQICSDSCNNKIETNKNKMKKSYFIVFILYNIYICYWKTIGAFFKTSFKPCSFRRTIENFFTLKILTFWSWIPFKTTAVSMTTVSDMRFMGLATNLYLGALPYCLRFWLFQSWSTIQYRLKKYS